MAPIRNVQVDDAGNFHCWKCGNGNFTEKRTFAAKATIGIGALLTSKKLKCQACGAYNKTGHAEPYRGATTQGMSAPSSGGSGTRQVSYRANIADDEFRIQTDQVTQLLSDGHKVKITIMFRGREVFHPELGKRLADLTIASVATIAEVETALRLDGRDMTLVLAPKQADAG